MINILLIDQEPLFQQAFSRMIAETEECQLIGIAENSKEAFEIASRYHPQIVFCDVVLGMENGIALCNLIKEHFPEITTYILSNYCSFQMIRHSMDAGVEEYLYKPLSRKKLSELIERNNASSLNEEENLQQEALLAAIEQKDYKKAYDTAKELVEYLFEECERREQHEQAVYVRIQSDFI